ncbi:MAG: helix-turn-helix transcriptional regulator [Candidatus Saccharicenans sp.]
MEKILLLSSKRKLENLINETIGKRGKVIVYRAHRKNLPDNKISLILTDCDYKCRLDKCLKKFLFIYHHNSIPAVILKPVLIKKGADRPGFFFRILNDAGFEAFQKDWLLSLRSSKYYAGLPTFPSPPFSQLSKIIEVQRIIIESDHESFQIKDLAGRVDCSSSWLSVNFGRLAGISLRTFRARERCCRALWQLVSTDKPIKVIALEAGYEPLYFSHLFHRTLGAPPSSLRKLLSYSLRLKNSNA